MSSEKIPPSLGELIDAAGLGQRTCAKCGTLLNAFSISEDTTVWSCKECNIPDATIAKKDLRS